MPRVNPPYARGVSQLMYVGDSEPVPAPRPPLLGWAGVGGFAITLMWLATRRPGQSFGAWILGR